MKEYQKRDKGKGKNKRAEFSDWAIREPASGHGILRFIYYSVTKSSHGRRQDAPAGIQDGEDNSSSHDMMTTMRPCKAKMSWCTSFATRKKNTENNGAKQIRSSVMDRIAKETEGHIIDAANNRSRHEYFQQIAQELRTSYELGVLSDKSVKDETFRKIVIRAEQAGLRFGRRLGIFRDSQPSRTRGRSNPMRGMAASQRG